MRLRTLLALMFSLLLAFTAALVGWRGYSSSRTQIKHFTQVEFAQANFFTAHHVVDFLDDPANRLLSEMTLRARRGMLKLDDDRVLGCDLAERLRVNPTLAWISYSDAATGRFVGVWRTEKGDVVLNLNSPGPNHVREMVIAPEGTTVPYFRPQPADYDPRTFPWYKNAAASHETVWSPPYLFLEGVEGITASRAWRTSDNAPVSGVFTVDFFLRDLRGLLDGIATNFGGLYSAILEPDGTLICNSRSEDAAAIGPALSAWVKANPQFKDNNKDNGHLNSIIVNGTEYLAALNHVEGDSGLKCIVASLAPRAQLFHGVEHAAQQMLEIALAALALAVVLGVVMAYRISQPLHLLGEDLANVGRFQLAEGSRPLTLVREVRQLHDAADRMKTGLRSFIKYVPGDLVRDVLASGREAQLGGEIRRLTVFFSDIEGFTTYSEMIPPNELVHELAAYFEIVSGRLREHSGEIDKFIGDGVLAFFNAPKEVKDHEHLACRATLAALRDLVTWQQDKGGPPFRTRVGLHAGEVLVGNMGTSDRLAYTVLGDVVNVSSRLENLNKIFGTQILASGEVRGQTGEEFEWRHIDRAAVAGRKGAMEIYELLGRAGQVDPERLRRRDLYEQALGLYFTRAFREAGESFAKLAGDDSADKAAAVMVARCSAFAAQPPPADWDGVFLHEKG
jgi:adenylate cyclase